MTHKFNKFKSITKGLIGPNIIFPAAYILFSAESCFGLPLAKGTSFAGNNQEHGNQLKNISGTKGDALPVPGLSGRGILLDLDNYLCGVFVPSDTKEVFIIKLDSKNGWMQYMKQGAEPDRLRFCYDVPDPRIIKVDYRLVEQLRQRLDQSPDLVDYSSDKEDFWHRIEKDPSWYDIAFCDKKAPMSNCAIFREDYITSSMAFTKKLYKKFKIADVGTTTLVTTKLSISGGVPSAALSDLKKVGFILTKDANSLVDLVKNMLEGGVEWGTKAGIVDTKAYITCPASVVDGALQFDGCDLDIQAQDTSSSVRLEGYTSGYCYLNDGAYYHLMPLDDVKSVVEIDKEFAVPNYYQARQELPLVPTTVIPPKPLVDASATEINSDNLPDNLPGPPGFMLHLEAPNDGNQDRINGEQVDPITNGPEGEVTQPGNPNQRVHTSPMGYTGNAKQRAHVPTNESTEAVPPPPQPVPPPMPNTNGLIPPAPPMMSNNVIPPPPPLPPISTPISSGSGVSSNSAGSPPPPPLSPPSNDRSALLDQIKQGAKLKKVEGSEINKKLPEVKTPPKVETPRDALLRQIKEGVKLKKVEVNKSDDVNTQKDEQPHSDSSAIDEAQEKRRKEKRENLDLEEGGLVGALRRALEQRKKDFNPQDEEGSDNDDDDKEEEDKHKWDDEE